jgi:hypothetical protein
MEPEARKRQIMLWYTVAAVIGVLLFQYFWVNYTQIETIPYSQFEQLLAEGKVAEVTVGTDSIEGTLKEPLRSGKHEFFSARIGIVAEASTMSLMGQESLLHCETTVSVPTENRFLLAIL